MKRINKLIFLVVMVFVFGFAFIIKLKAAEPPGEKWVINKSPEVLAGAVSESIVFTCNNMTFNSIRIGYKYQSGSTYTQVNRSIVYNKISAYQSGVWNDELYRTIIFATAPTGNLLTWLQANAVKESEEPEVPEELIGYRPLLDSDIGKKFGVDLYSKIYFNLDYEVGYELFNGASPGTADRILIDWVVPESSYRLELWSFFLDVEWEDRDLENMIFFSHGRNIGDNRIDLYYANFSLSPASYGYVITDYTLPYKSYIYHIETDIVKDFILVKDLNEELSYEEGYIDGFADAKRANGLTINGILYSGQDLYDYAFNKGLSDTESNSGIAILVSGFFSSLAMFGNVEILPGLKIFYIVGFFLVIGLMIFLFKIRGK